MSVAKESSGFSLVEVTLALGVAGFCLLAVFGLLPAGLQSNAATIEQTAATNTMSSVTADLKNTPRLATKSPRYGISLPLNAAVTIYLTEDGVAVPDPVNARYRVVLTGSTTPSGRMATWLNVKASWPAAATAPNAAGSVQTFLALDRN